MDLFKLSQKGKRESKVRIWYGLLGLVLGGLLCIAILVTGWYLAIVLTLLILPLYQVGIWTKEEQKEPMYQKEEHADWLKVSRNIMAFTACMYPGIIVGFLVLSLKFILDLLI